MVLTLLDFTVGQVWQCDLENIKGWSEDISKITREEELPIELLEYVSFIEEFIKVPIKLISVGPDRSETIYRIPK